MPSNHFVAIGGTGQHVALAFVDLLALEVWVRPEEAPDVPTTKIWLFDADAGGTSATGKTAWNELAEQATFVVQNAGANNQNAGWGKIANQQKPFDESLSATRFRELFDSEVHDLFFSEDQGDVRYRDGYFGQAAVGATLFEHVLSLPHRPFQELLESPYQAGERVFLAGSAVGGTGSGCIPYLTEHLGTRMGADGQSTRLMSTLFLPWFQLSGGSGSDAQRRNEEMQSRAATGLMYYGHELSRYSATVVLGEPDPGLAPSRPWAGDVQQPTHGALELPFYAAAAALRFFYGEARTNGLYSIVAPAVGGQSKVHEATIVRSDSAEALDTATRNTLGNLYVANREFCRRMDLVVSYLKARKAGFPPAMVPDLEIPELPRSAEGWLAHIEQALQAKRRSLARLQSALGSVAALDQAVPGPSGIPDIRAWVRDAGDIHHESDLCRAIGTSSWHYVVGGQHAFGAQRAQQYAATLASSNRFLPSIQAEDAEEGTAVPVAGRVGSLHRIEQVEIEQRIRARVLSPASYPNKQSRARFLQHVLGKERTRPSVHTILPTGVGQTITHFEKLSPRDRIVAEWAMLVLAVAQGLTQQVPLVASPAQTGPAGMLAKVTNGRFRLMVRAKGRVFQGGYSDPATFVVPAPAPTSDWMNLWHELTNQLQRNPDMYASVASWARMLERLAAESDVGRCPSWVLYLRGLTSNDAVAAPFGLDARPFVESSGWGYDGHATLPLHAPITSGGSADASWAEKLFRHFRLPITRTAPTNDPDASMVQSALSRLPVFSVARADGSLVRCRALWLDASTGGTDRSGLGSRVQERFYVGRGVVWDIFGDDDDVLRPLRDRDIQVPEIGAIVINENGVERSILPDLPVREEFLDLVDTSMLTDREPRLSGNSVNYKVPLRGRGVIDVSVPVNPSLALIQNWALWPNFRSEGWRSRFLRVDAGPARLTFELYCAAHSDPEHRLLAVKQTDEFRAPKVPGRAHFFEFELNENATDPVFLVIHRKDEDASRASWVFSLLPRLRRLQRSPAEQWGVDFGTHSSVVAYKSPEMHEAAVLLPTPEADATLMVGPARYLKHGNYDWFSTWPAGWGSRVPEVSLVPTRMVRHLGAGAMDNIPLEKQFMTSWYLDHGRRVESSDYQVSADSDLKWGVDAALKKQAFLFRLLEQALAWRAGAHPSGANQLPASVNVVFTLPLAQRSQLVTFDREVRDILSRLSKNTGVDFRSSYEWESVAASVRVVARRSDTVFAALDLGGGSLDLWGAFLPKNRANDDVLDPSNWTDRADSHHIGGRLLLDRLSEKDRARFDACMREGNSDNQPAYDVLADGPNGGRFVEDMLVFFDVVVDLCARWLVALILEAQKLAPSVRRLEVAPLGRGWYVGDKDRHDPRRLLKLLENRCAELGVTGIEFALPSQMPVDIVAKKTFVAQRAAELNGRAVTQMQIEPTCYLGLEVDKEGGDSLSWTAPVPTQWKLTRGDRVHVRQPFHPPLRGPLLDDAESLALEVDGSLNQPVTQGRGFRNNDMSELQRSPLSALVDRAMSKWKSGGSR